MLLTERQKIVVAIIANGLGDAGMLLLIWAASERNWTMIVISTLLCISPLVLVGIVAYGNEGTPS